MNAEPSNQGQFHLHYRELAEHLPNSVVYIFDQDLRILFAGGSLMAKFALARRSAGRPAASRHYARQRICSSRTPLARDDSGEQTEL